MEGRTIAQHQKRVAVEPCLEASRGNFLAASRNLAVIVMNVVEGLEAFWKLRVNLPD